MGNLLNVANQVLIDEIRNEDGLFKNEEIDMDGNIIVGEKIFNFVLYQFLKERLKTPLRQKFLLIRLRLLCHDAWEVGSYSSIPLAARIPQSDVEGSRNYHPIMLLSKCPLIWIFSCQKHGNNNHDTKNHHHHRNDK